MALLDGFPYIPRLSMHYCPNGAFPSASSILPWGFRPSWQVNASVIVCILIDWVISLLPRGSFERWSWQIPVAASISQRLHLQYLTANVSGITPVKRVEILHLSTLYGHACFSLSCPCGRTLRSWSDVFPCGTAVRGRWTGVFVLVVPALWPRVWWPSLFRPSWQVDVAVIVCILID